MHSLKTGRLIASSVGVVLILGETSLNLNETILRRCFADEPGVLFQIVDDILDVTGSDEEPREAERQRREARQAHLRERIRP